MINKIKNNFFFFLNFYKMNSFEFFYGNSISYINYNNKAERLSSLNNNFYIFFNIFYNLSNIQSGGSIYISNTNSLIYLENNKFSYCFTNNNGGAIFLSVSKIFINKNCGDQCYSTTSIGLGGGQFLYIQSQNIINYFNFSSINKCSYTNNGIYSSILYNSIKINISNINSSNNYLKRYCSHLLLYSGTLFILNSNFINSIVEGSIGFQSYFSTSYKYYTNCINNSQGIGENGFIHTNNGSYIAYKCIFQKNNINPLFKLFDLYSGSLILNECWIQNEGILGNPSILNSKSISFTFTCNLNQCSFIIFQSKITKKRFLNTCIIFYDK